jgi:acyl-CoA reductase-like NAD-dependent aldehyde dehydrogenase
MQAFTSHHIAGNWVAAQPSEIFKVHDSNTEEAIATGLAGTVEGVNRAVTAAKRVFDAWCRLPVETLATYLDKISAGPKTRLDEIAAVAAREVGEALASRRAVDIVRWN